jgi:hypothetical protein
MIAGRHPIVQVLTLSQIAIIIAAAGNPYIWAGGVGLFFVALLSAVLAHLEDAEPARAASALTGATALEAGAS